jgi:organic hydroperoxide reductase OsmC/OhrA
MKISASIDNRAGMHEVLLTTDGQSHSLAIPPEPAGFGSSANGGELLFLALATCYCNDIYREAAKRGIRVDRVEVEVDGDFGAAGEPARDIVYHTSVTAQASEADILDLMRHTDQVAEIHNSLRVATPVRLGRMEGLVAAEPQR